MLYDAIGPVLSLGLPFAAIAVVTIGKAGRRFPTCSRHRFQESRPAVIRFWWTSILTS